MADLLKTNLNQASIQLHTKSIKELTIGESNKVISFKVVKTKFGRSILTELENSSFIKV